MVIVGAGPGGAAAAYHLARAGCRVLLLDRAPFPRHKPCGGALSRKVARVLPMDYDSLDSDEIFGAEFTFMGSDSFQIEVASPLSRLVERRDFDRKLVGLAEAEGAVFHDAEEVFGMAEEEEGWRVTTSRGGTYLSAYVIGADGPRGFTARLLNPGHFEPMGIALEEEVTLENVQFPRLVRLDFGRFPWGYAWIFPKRGLSSVGCGAIYRRGKVSLKAEYERFKAGFPFLPRKVGKVRGHLLPYFGDFPYKRAERRLLLVGDAARLMDPFLGEGIYYALASGTFAARAVHIALKEGKRADTLYLSMLREEVIGELKHAARMADFVYARLDVGYRVLRRSSRLGLLYIKVMSGEFSYADFNKNLFQTMKEAGKERLKAFFTRKG